MFSRILSVKCSDNGGQAVSGFFGSFSRFFASVTPSPHYMSSLTLVKSFTHATTRKRRTRVCRSRQRSSSSGLTHSRLLFPPYLNLPRIVHQAHLAYQKRSPYLTRVSHRLTADVNNKGRGRTLLVPRRLAKTTEGWVPIPLVCGDGLPGFPVTSIHCLMGNSLPSTPPGVHGHCLGLPYASECLTCYEFSISSSFRCLPASLFSSRRRRCWLLVFGE